MNPGDGRPIYREELPEGCQRTRAAFSSYLDGALDGQMMAHLAAHMNGCTSCAREFAAWRAMQTALGHLGPAQPPLELQNRLRDVLASELMIGRHLSPLQRLRNFTEATLAPLFVRVGAGLAATAVILGSAAAVLGAAMPVQANDDRMTHLSPPRLLYAGSMADPVAVSGRHYAAVVVDAKVNAEGQVYDFDMLEGPRDAGTRTRITANLLGSVFKPASVFGSPVPGHVIVTYTAVSARG